MKKVLFPMLAIIMVLSLALPIGPVKADRVPPATTSQPVQITFNQRYDRNPSFFIGRHGTCWLFFTRGRDPIGIRSIDYEPDYDSYDIYYKTAKSIPALQKAKENLVPGSDIVNFNTQRDVAALQASDGTIWVFTSSGYAASTDARIFYYKYDGASWSGPNPIEGTSYAGHIDALEYGGKIWVFFDAWDYILQVISYDKKKALWSTPDIIHDGATLAKGIIHDGKFYVVWASMSGSPGKGIFLSTLTHGGTWKSTSSPIASWPGLTNWDPVLVRDGDMFRLFWAPSNSEQFIATSKSCNPTDPTSWSKPVRVTTASYEAENWWDFWPQPYSKEGNKDATYLFYTSERNSNGTARADGNIWMLEIGQKSR